MIDKQTSGWNKLLPLILLAAALLLTSCKPHVADIEVARGTKQEFAITVRNTSASPLMIDDRLLGLSIESSVKVEVADSGGAIVPLCGHIDYVISEGILSVAPGGETTIQIPEAAIYLTHCLTADESYLFRAVLIRQGKHVSRSRWIPFRAVSPFTGKKSQRPMASE